MFAAVWVNGADQLSEENKKRGKKMFKSMGMPEFYQEAKRSQLAIIDVREVFEYEMGHI